MVKGKKLTFWTLNPHLQPNSALGDHVAWYYSGTQLIPREGVPLLELADQIGPDRGGLRQWQNFSDHWGPCLATSFQTPETEAEAAANRIP